MDYKPRRRTVCDPQSFVESPRAALHPPLAGNPKEKRETIKLKELVLKEKCELIVAKQRALGPGIPAI